jgi:hypothetical protein
MEKPSMKIVGCDFRPGGTRPKPSAVVRRPSLPSSSWTFKAVGEVLDSRGRKALIPAFFVALPAILFYAILFRKAINVPFMDDYEALLDFLNRMTELQSGSAKASYFLASQFNEYKTPLRGR